MLDPAVYENAIDAINDAQYRANELGAKYGVIRHDIAAESYFTIRPFSVKADPKMYLEICSPIGQEKDK